MHVQRVQDRVLTFGFPGSIRVQTGGGGAPGWWEAAGVTPWAAYAAKGAANQAASYTDLTGNGNDAGVGVAPTWDSTNGWIFNGTTQYLTTTFVPQSDQSQSAFVQFTTKTGVERMFGAEDAMGAFTIRNRATLVAYYNGFGAGSAAPTLTAGNLGIAGAQGYRDGVANGGALPAWGGACAQAVYIGCENLNGAALNFTAYYCQYFILYDVALTAPQAALIAAAMAAI